ncbi:unnamed protein product [Rotaria sp. Silwood2]|nr:unnamed protein product [Rotaria sp. Silwood2]CAF4177671.1 unnamed protein product [Rotaria sp. Silwood2]
MNITDADLLHAATVRFIAEHIIKQRKQENIDLIISAVVEWTIDFIVTNIHTWLESQNYLNEFLKIIHKTPEQRNYTSQYASIFGTIGNLI